RPTPPARRTSVPYLAAFVLFIAAMCAKTVTCTLPAALLLVIWWKRGRLRLADVARTIPFFFVGVGMGLRTAVYERDFIGATGAHFALSVADRILIAGRAVWFYAA